MILRRRRRRMVVDDEVRHVVHDRFMVDVRLN
jgi:hypothetical protein